MGNRIASLLSAFIFLPFLLATATIAATLDIQLATEPATLDPQRQSGDWPDWVAGDLFEGLVTEDASGNPVPGQAASWTISPDGLTYSFRLRDGLRWSDGQPLDSGDFLLAFRRLLEPKLAAEFAFIQFPIKNAEAFNSGVITDPSALGVATPDGNTVVITLEQPMPYFLQALVQPGAYPVPRHLVEKFGDDWTKPQNIVSNGAFKLAEWKPGIAIRAVRNENYQAASEVRLGEVIYHFTDDEAVTLASFDKGAFEIATQFPTDSLAKLQARRPGEARIVPTLGVWYYVLNLKTPPFADPNVRRALSMAIDLERLGTEVAQTGQLAAYGMVPPGVPGFDSALYVPDWAAMERSERVAEAKSLLAAAGYEADKPLKFTLRTSTMPAQVKISEAVAQNWKEIGAEVDFVRKEIPEHHDFLMRHDFTAGTIGWILDYSDAADSLALMHTGHPNNYPSYSNPDFDALLDKARTEQDAVARARLLHEAEKMAMDETAVIPLTWAVSKNLVAPAVSGFVDNVRNVHRARWLSLKE